MALSAHLQFGDNQSGRYNKDYLLVGCHSSCRRPHNDLRPDGPALYESVEVTMVAPGKDDTMLQDWFSNNEELSGRILFDLSSVATDNGTPTRALLFEDARCFALEESYDKDTRYRRLLKLCFEAETITMEDINFSKPCP